MLSVFVFFEMLLPPCLMVTHVTGISHTIMDNFYMEIKVGSLCSLVVTLVTGIFYTFMY